MLAASAELKWAQKLKEYLSQHHLLDRNRLPVKELGRIYFPIMKKVKIPPARVIATVLDTTFTFPEKEKIPAFEELLREKLTHSEIKLLPKSQESVGKILILEMPEELQPKERVVAEAYLRANPYLETVVKKEETHTGIYRTRKVKILAGKKTKEALHQENKVKMKVNLEETYFSARLAHERLRIASLVKKKEKILVMFSGVAPYPLVIAKNSPAEKIVGVEINPQAHQLALQNVELNHLQKKISLYLGDVRKVLPQLREKFDRVVMPLPKTGEDFLGVALPAVKKNGFIQLYAFLSEAEVPAEKKRIVEICREWKYKIKVVEAVKCGQFSPRTFRYCFDLKVL